MNLPFFKDPDFYRRQTLWFLLSALLLMVNRYLLPVGAAVPGGPELTYGELDKVVGSDLFNVVVVLFAVAAILALYGMADFKGRSQQPSSALAVVVICVAVVVLGLVFLVPHPGIWFFTPLLVAIFSLLAYFDVKRDIAKLKSLDRLR